MARALNNSTRAEYWGKVANATTAAMDEKMWDETSGFYYDRYFNDSLMSFKTVAGFYPLLIQASHSRLSAWYRLHPHSHLYDDTGFTLTLVYLLCNPLMIQASPPLSSICMVQASPSLSSI